MKLQQSDYLLIFGGVAVVLAASFAAQTAGVGPMIELPIDVITAAVILAGVYFIYKTVGAYGGDIGRYLAVIGIGLTYYAVSFIPHVQLHIQGVKQVGPVSAMAIFMFQHVATVFVFGVVAYGFYLFWKGGSR